MAKNKKKLTEAEVDRELIGKGKDVVHDFDEAKKIVVLPVKSDSKLISMRIPTSMLGQLRHVAIKRGNIGYQQVIKTYIFEGLRREIERSDSYEVENEPNVSFATSGSFSIDIIGSNIQSGMSYEGKHVS